jgi:protein SCO1/2
MATTGTAGPAVASFGARVQARLGALVARPLFWVCFVIVAMGWPIVRTLRIELPPPLPVLATIPDFTLTDQTGHAFGSADLKGRVWVADFIFTRCPSVCPRLTDAMAKLQYRARNLGDAFRLVSFSVDPAYDTPPVLTAYAGVHRASPRTWAFLTGAPDAVKRVVVEGLKVSMGRDAGGPIDAADFGSIFHGTHLVLVDPLLRIRGYYDATEPDAVDVLVADLGMLVNRGE